MVGVDRGAHVSPPEFLRRADELWPASFGRSRCTSTVP